MKRKKLIFILPVIAVLATLAYRFGLPVVRKQLSVNREKIAEGESTQVKLLENWTIASETDKEIVVTRQEDDAEIQSKVVLLKTQPEIDNFSNYVDRLVQGAQQTLPSLRYSSQTEVQTENDWQAKELIGYYTSSGDRVNLIQQLYFENGQLITITASYGEENKEDKESEINSVFDFLKHTYL